MSVKRDRQGFLGNLNCLYRVLLKEFVYYNMKVYGFYRFESITTVLKNSLTFRAIKSAPCST